MKLQLECATNASNNKFDSDEFGPSLTYKSRTMFPIPNRVKNELTVMFKIIRTDVPTFVTEGTGSRLSPK